MQICDSFDMNKHRTTMGVTVSIVLAKDHDNDGDDDDNNDGAQRTLC